MDVAHHFHHHVWKKPWNRRCRRVTGSQYRFQPLDQLGLSAQDPTRLRLRSELSENMLVYIRSVCERVWTIIARWPFAEVAV